MDAGSVYVIGQGRSATEVTAEAAGAKGCQLLRMESMRLPVPAAFILGTAFSRRYFESGRRLPHDFPEQIRIHLRILEELTGKSFGSSRRPLLVSVRSGAPVSMPGMMDTVLNIGLGTETALGLKRLTGNPHLVWDAYRRLVQAFAEVVHGVPGTEFESLAAQHLERVGTDTLQELDSAALQSLAMENLECYDRLVGQPFPQDPVRQLCDAVEAVIRSWQSPRAREYRRLHRLDDALGTAVTVQAMVFGNAGSTSGSGVGFSRNPATGEPGLYLDFAFNAQGDDVVSGRRPISEELQLATVLPSAYSELGRAADALEREFRDLQDFEFTIEEGRLHFLQTRAAQRTPLAALRVAVDMVKEGLISPATALQRLELYDLDTLLHKRVRPDSPAAIGHAVTAGTGVAAGHLVLSGDRAREFAAAGEPAILVRPDLPAEDAAGIAASAGVLTIRGARTSHAAVVARQMGKVCLVGCRDLVIEPERSCVTLGGRTIREGEWISLDGDAGQVFAGQVAIETERPDDLLRKVERWRTEQGSAVEGT